MICGPCGTQGLATVTDLKVHRHSCPWGPDGGWLRVIEMRRAGDVDGASAVAAGLMGVEGPKMSEEQKAKLRAYSASPEGKARAKARRAEAKIMKKVNKGIKERKAHGSIKASRRR